MRQYRKEFIREQIPVQRKSTRVNTNISWFLVMKNCVRMLVSGCMKMHLRVPVQNSSGVWIQEE